MISKSVIPITFYNIDYMRVNCLYLYIVKWKNQNHQMMTNIGLDLENITHFIYKPAAVPWDEYIHMKMKVPQ